MKLFGFLKCKAMFKWVWGKFCHTITPARFMKEHLTITSDLAIKLVSVSWATVVTTGNLSFYSKQLGINCNCEKGLTACNSIFGCFSHSCELEKVGSVHMQLIHYCLEKKTDCRAVMNTGLLIFRAVAEPRISTKSAKSREIPRNSPKHVKSREIR